MLSPILFILKEYNASLLEWETDQPVQSALVDDCGILKKSLELFTFRVGMGQNSLSIVAIACLDDSSDIMNEYAAIKYLQPLLSKWHKKPGQWFASRRGGEKQNDEKKAGETQSELKRTKLKTFLND